MSKLVSSYTEDDIRVDQILEILGELIELGKDLRRTRPVDESSHTSTKFYPPGPIDDVNSLERYSIDK